MTEQEQLRQLKEEYENMTIPEAGRERLQAGIDRARMEKKRAERARRRSTWTAVAAAAVVLISAQYQWTDCLCHGKYSRVGRFLPTGDGAAVQLQ